MLTLLLHLSFLYIYLAIVIQAENCCNWKCSVVTVPIRCTLLHVLYIYCTSFCCRNVYCSYNSSTQLWTHALMSPSTLNDYLPSPFPLLLTTLSCHLFLSRETRKGDTHSGVGRFSLPFPSRAHARVSCVNLVFCTVHRDLHWRSNDHLSASN